MKITAVETLYLSRGVTLHSGAVQWLWVRIHTDAGLVGLGETYPDPPVEAAVVHRRLAPVLLGRDPSQIDRLWLDMFDKVNFQGWAGAEMRAISAVDMALWDLAGKAAGVPVYQAARGRLARAHPHLQHLLRLLRLLHAAGGTGARPARARASGR